MEQTVFLQLSLVIVLATFVSWLMRLLRQPLIMGYILTGILVGPAFLYLIQDQKAFASFSQIGIALLLFIIGLGLNVTVVKSLGKPVLVTAAAQIAGLSLISYLLATALGLTAIEALVMAVALLFSSTIIVVKVLTDKREQSRLYGQLAIGILLVEDILATLALLLVSASRGDGLPAMEIGLMAAKGLALLGLLALVSSKILPRLTKFFAESQEFLFLFAIAWGFGIASLFEIAGWSFEIGALFAGVSLASLPYTQEIASRLKPLRDFFVVLFFIVLGEGLGLANLAAALFPALLFSLIIIIGKPLIVMYSLGLLGYTKRTSFKTGIHLSQISEFSIVLVVLAQNVGLVSPIVSGIITLVAVITIAASTYLTKYDEWLFRQLEHRIRLFENRVSKEDKKVLSRYPLVLFGYRKGGHEFLRAFKEMKKRYVVVDYNPEVVETLERQRVNYVYGDATDYELLEEIGIEQARLIVSTITDFSTNKALVQLVRQKNQRAVIVCHGDSYNDAADLYRLGATYVMLPHFIGSERISGFIRRHGMSKEAFDDYRQKHLASLGRAALKA